MTDPAESADPVRQLLLGADAARSLAPVDPAVLSRLIEDTVATDPPVRRYGVTWVVAAAAVVLIAGVGGVMSRSLDGQDILSSPPSASGRTDATPDAGTGDEVGPAPALAPVAGTTELTAAAVPARCARPTPDIVAMQQLAFAGTVIGIDGDAVTLQTSGVYHGTVGTTVVVTASRADLHSLIQATTFEVGGSYLVSATDGRVSVCGLSGKATADLRSLYSQAFTG